MQQSINSVEQLTLRKPVNYGVKGRVFRRHFSQRTYNLRYTGLLEGTHYIQTDKIITVIS